MRRALGPLDPLHPCCHCAAPSQACQRAPRPYPALPPRPTEVGPARPGGGEGVREQYRSTAAPAPSRPRCASTLYSCSRVSRPGLRHGQRPGPGHAPALSKAMPWPQQGPGPERADRAPAEHRRSGAAARPSCSCSCTALLRSAASGQYFRLKVHRPETSPCQCPSIKLFRTSLSLLLCQNNFFFSRCLGAAGSVNCPGRLGACLFGITSNILVRSDQSTSWQACGASNG